MRVDDIEGVIRLAAEEVTAPHWPVAEFYRMLDVIAAAPQRRGAWVLLLAAPYATETAFGAAGVALPGSQPEGGLADDPSPLRMAGFAMASHVAGICDLEAVVVHADWRGRRHGAALVKAAAAWGESLGGCRLELEVRASNQPALRLYRRMGFADDGTRPGYYRNPEEDAVLMSLRLHPSAVAKQVTAGSPLG